MNVLNIGMLMITTVAVLMCVIPLLTGKKYEPLLTPLDDDKFSMKYTYCIGLKWLELMKEKYNSKWHLRQRQLVNIIWGKDYVDYYVMIYSAKRLSLALVVTAIAMCLAMVSGNSAVILFIFALIAGGAVYYTYSNDLETQMKNKAEALVSELPEIVSRLALLLNAGMILREAWETVAESGDTEVYQEMKFALNNMRNGVSEYEAVYIFGQRSENADVRKFCSRITQAIEKGGAHLAIELSQQSLEMFELKRQLVTRKAGEAAQKSLIPILIMFIGILVMVIVPIMSSF